MPDTPFKAMGRDPDSRRTVSQEAIECEDCGWMIKAGDWPFCKSGDPRGHQR